MSTCTKNGKQLVPCDDLAKSIGAINLDSGMLAVASIAVYQSQDADGNVVSDDVFAVSSQGDNTPLLFKYCPFCQTKIGNFEE